VKAVVYDTYGPPDVLRLEEVARPVPKPDGLQSFGRCKDSLGPGGAYLATDHLHNLALVLWTSAVGSRKVRFPIPPKYAKEDVLFLKQLTVAR
jgi:hypothetical protein